MTETIYEKIKIKTLWGIYRTLFLCGPKRSASGGSA